MGSTLLLLVKIVDGLAFAVEHAPGMIAAWRGHLATVRKIIAENRDPTAEEWQTVEDTAKAQTDALRAVVEADENG